jgi:hypothetical protein
MDLPTEERIRELRDYYRLPVDVLSHIGVVKKTVLYLATELNKAGEGYNLELLSAAADLHDLGKFADIKRPELGEREKFGFSPILEENFVFWEEEIAKFPEDYNHEDIAAEVLKDYSELVEVVLNHTPRQILKEGLSKEAILLNYVDKRASNHHVVTLEQRFAYLAERYLGHEDSGTKKIFDRYKQIETDIFNKLGFPAEELGERMKHE